MHSFKCMKEYFDACKITYWCTHWTQLVGNVCKLYLRTVVGRYYLWIVVSGYYLRTVIGRYEL